MTNSLAHLFNRDLSRLKTEIESFKDESNLWKVKEGVINSCGNLCLHICGNLQHFIGKVLGETDYVRDRDSEFSKKNVPELDLIMEIERTEMVVESVLSNLDQGDLEKMYPVDFLKNGATTEEALIHLYGHLNWHLGNINYLRRILES